MGATVAEIFVSYKKDDREIAERIVSALCDSGKKVWWDDAITPHEAWDAMIEKEIAAARIVLVLWSPRSVHSDWVRSEAHYAQDHHKLVPVMIERCDIPLAFMLRQAVDLTNGDFTPANPQWQKLLSWIDAIDSGDSGSIPEPSTLTPADAAVPVKAATGERWLGPASRPKAIAAFAGIALVIALVAFLMRSSIGFASAGTPDVYVDRFTVAENPNIPAGFDQAFADEMSAMLNAASRVTPLEGDGTRHLNAYQMSGNIRYGEGKILLFGKIYAPGIAAPILSPRIEVPPAQLSNAAKFLGSETASLLRCIATASDSAGSAIHVLPEAAIRPWAQYCEGGILGNSDTSTMVGLLESVVKADPEFSNGWASLAEYYTIDEMSDAKYAKFQNAISKALETDPGNPKATMLKAVDTLGVIRPTFPLKNFDEFEAMAVQANEARPTDCGCEAQIYSAMLAGSGRQEDALKYLDRTIANDPANQFTRAWKTAILMDLGRMGEAGALVDDLKASWPGGNGTLMAEFIYALANRNWDGARAAAGRSQAFPGQPQAVALIDALEAGNAPAIAEASEPIVGAFGRAPYYHPMTGYLLGMAGRDKEVAAVFAKQMEKYSLWGLPGAFSAPMKGARAQPEFLNMIRKLGLPAYWRHPDRRPDVCEHGNREPLCKLI